MLFTPSIVVLGAGAILAALLLPTQGHAQPAASAGEAYPSRAIRLIVPFPPGGGSDVFGRMIAASLTERLGQQVIVDNRGGAGGIIGTDAAAKSPPNGYTIVIVAGSFTIYPSLQTLPFDPVKSFAPVARLATGPNVLAVHPSLPVASVKDLIALAKRRPGELAFGTSGIAGSPHMATELFRLMAGIDFLIVHYKGGGPAMIDLLGGQIQGTMGSLIQTMPHMKSGKLKVLATGGAQRTALLPEVPTIAESGLPGYDVNVWFGVLAPAGTPAPIVGRLSSELRTAVASNDAKQRFQNEGVEAAFLGPAEFTAFIGREITSWAQVVKKASIKIE